MYGKIQSTQTAFQGFTFSNSPMETPEYAECVSFEESVWMKKKQIRLNLHYFYVYCSRSCSLIDFLFSQE